MFSSLLSLLHVCGFNNVPHTNGDPEGRDVTQTSRPQRPLHESTARPTLTTLQHFVVCFLTFNIEAPQPSSCPSFATSSGANDNPQRRQQRQAGAPRRALSHSIVVTAVTNLQHLVECFILHDNRRRRGRQQKRFSNAEFSLYHHQNWYAASSDHRLTVYQPALINSNPKWSVQLFKDSSCSTAAAYVFNRVHNAQFSTNNLQIRVQRTSRSPLRVTWLPRPHSVANYFIDASKSRQNAIVDSASSTSHCSSPQQLGSKRKQQGDATTSSQQHPIVTPAPTRHNLAVDDSKLDDQLQHLLQAVAAKRYF